MSAETELAARMPWTVARPESWWSVTGNFAPNHTFSDCLARVLPDEILDPGWVSPVFEVLVYGESRCVQASAITAATPLLFVLADDPKTAYYVDDQPVVDAGSPS